MLERRAGPGEERDPAGDRNRAAELRLCAAAWRLTSKNEASPSSRAGT